MAKCQPLAPIWGDQLWLWVDPILVDVYMPSALQLRPLAMQIHGRLEMGHAGWVRWSQETKENDARERQKSTVQEKARSWARGRETATETFQMTSRADRVRKAGCLGTIGVKEPTRYRRGPF